MNKVDTTTSQERHIKSREEVNVFLNQAKECLNDESSWMINNETWANSRVNKTQAFMAEKNLCDEDVAEVIRELQVVNYCYTSNDKNERFSGETFWFFGIKRMIIDSEEKLYVKLKIRRFDNDFLLIMSFHPEQPINPEDELTFPYARPI